MQVIIEKNNTWLLRLDPGEEFIAAVQDFCAEHDIHNAWLSAIGATHEVEIAVYNINAKKYETKEFKELLEILNINGNITLKDALPSEASGEGRGKSFCHAHGVFGRPDMTTIGGHIISCVVSATCEIKLEAGDGAMRREFDEKTGLHLLHG